ncbi:MAG: sigma-54-dependent Fis family transcriptional regulator, partial [Spirochaetota bacterium]|nr:sigma-54-dependent Fis family transcriptional regulator [Spirochaetota bacterium]
RKNDILILIDYFLTYFSKLSGKKKKSISKDAVKLLEDYPWHGNVRELKNVIERLNIMIESDTITDYDVKAFVLEQDTRSSFENLYDFPSLKDAKDFFEKKYIINKLKENEMNISKTAKALDIERSHLHKKIKKYNL